jgi:hypothetical protein
MDQKQTTAASVGADEQAELWWYAMYRDGGYEPKDMVVAWMAAAEMGAQLEAYVKWDIGATGTRKWRIEKFSRKLRETWFRTECSYGDDLIEYHFVLDDRDQAKGADAVEVVEIVEAGELG